MSTIGDTVIRGELTPGAFGTVQPIRGEQFVVEIVSVDRIANYTPHLSIVGKVHRVSVPFATRMAKLDPPVHVAFGTDQVEAIYVDFD
jgi:hypothetical protein